MYQKQSKDRQNSKNDHWCTNRHRSTKTVPCSSVTIVYTNRQQELSYRKQIARKLRTQYVEGIRRPKYYTVTLKSRLRVTHGHWKRNHWTDHTRLTILVELFDVKYYRKFEMWVEVTQVVESGTV